MKFEGAYGASCSAERDTPVIVLHPGRLSGKATIGHSRLSALLVANHYWRFGVKDVKASWDYLTDSDILVCCWYAAHYGPRAIRRDWREWRVLADDLLWSRNTVKQTPWPPRRP